MCSWYSRASNPLNTNSKNVFKFSGLGLVTKMFEYPKATAADTAKPKAADLPRPLEAVRDTVDLSKKTISQTYI